MTIVVAIKRHSDIDTTALAAALQAQAKVVDDVWGIGPVQVTTYKWCKPKGSWRIQFYSTLPPGMGGVHMNTRKNVPYAKVLVSEGTLAASHEFCEMLVDPLGTRFQTVGNRDYLVELCDPVEANSYESFNGVTLSDFILPSYYQEGAGFKDSLSVLWAPLALARYGYVSWIEDGNWWQSFADGGGTVTSRNLGPAEMRTRAEKDRLARA